MAYRVIETQDAKYGGQLVYEGPNTATTLTGRVEGTYVYVVEAGETQSDPCAIEVAPPSLGLAFGLFAIGLVVFAATLAVILFGSGATRRET